MSNTKLFLGVVLVAAGFGLWYWGRQNHEPGPPARPPVSPETEGRTRADPFPAETQKAPLK